MGDKLGKMVNKKLILMLIFCTNLSAEINQQSLKHLSIEKLSINSEAKIINISANPNNISLKNIQIAKPNKDILKRFITAYLYIDS